MKLDPHVSETIRQIDENISRISTFESRLKLWDLTSHLRTLLKNDSRPVEIQTSLPTPSVPEVPAVSQDLPSTLLGIRNHQWQRGIGHLGKAVGQLLVSGYATSFQSQNLLTHLSALAQAYDKLHQVISCMPVDKLRLIDEEVAGKK